MHDYNKMHYNNYSTYILIKSSIHSNAFWFWHVVNKSTVTLQGFYVNLPRTTTLRKQTSNGVLSVTPVHSLGEFEQAQKSKF